MPEPTPTPVFKSALDGNTVATTILQALGNALIDWWWLWLLVIIGGIALAMLNGWARRLEQERSVRRSLRRR